MDNTKITLDLYHLYRTKKKAIDVIYFRKTEFKEQIKLNLENYQQIQYDKYEY